MASGRFERGDYSRRIRDAREDPVLRDNPAIRDKPVIVGGLGEERGRDEASE